MFWDATKTFVPAESATTTPSDGKGGARTISTPVTPATRGRNSFTKAADSPVVLYIFQLPATRGVRIPLLRPADELGEVGQPARVSPLVVVPRQHLHHLPLDHLGRERVELRGVGRVVEVDGDQRLRDVLQDSLQGAIRRLLHRRVDLLRRRRLRQ